jgi:hypothetical protein
MSSVNLLIQAGRDLLTEPPLQANEEDHSTEQNTEYRPHNCSIAVSHKPRTALSFPTARTFYSCTKSDSRADTATAPRCKANSKSPRENLRQKKDRALGSTCVDTRRTALILQMQRLHSILTRRSASKGERGALGACVR